MASSQSHLSHTKYRSDIDGLRAIAVLSVVAFHAFPTLVKGGFIGVDMFFVISGFVISSIVFESLENGTFSFAEFYARRIKRIVPALLLVLTVSYGFGWFALLADEYKQLGKHVAAGAIFASNFTLWSEAGYFDIAAEMKPLLHLWSLGIEGQFYAVWPFALWVAWKCKYNLPAIIIASTAVSFCLNIMTVKTDAAAAFYSPQTRLWELQVGSLLAWTVIYKKDARGTITARLTDWATSVFCRAKFEPDCTTVDNLLSVLGFSILWYGAWHINKDFSFPGEWALFPVLGTTLIISAGPNAWLNRTFLSCRAALWVGVLSYPIYLWHWPLLAFARIIEAEVPSDNVRMAAIALSIVLSWLTYTLLERRIRLGGYSGTKVVILAILMMMVGWVGFSTYNHDGLPHRAAIHMVNKNQTLVEAFKEDELESHNECLGRIGLPGNVRYCNYSGDYQEIALIGDSHSRAMFDGMASLLKERGEGVLNIGGRLFLGVATYPKGDEFEIDVYKGGIRATQFAIDSSTIKTAIMFSRGPYYLENDNSTVYQLIDHPEVTDRKRIWEMGMKTTLDGFVKAGKNVIFVIDHPELSFDPKSCLDTHPIRITPHIRNPCAIPRKHYDNRNREYRRLVLSVLKDYPSVRVFDAAAYLCDKNWCWASKDGQILYRDRDHLSMAGSLFLSEELIKVIDGADSKLLISNP